MDGLIPWVTSVMPAYQSHMQGAAAALIWLVMAADKGFIGFCFQAAAGLRNTSAQRARGDNIMAATCGAYKPISSVAKGDRVGFDQPGVGRAHVDHGTVQANTRSSTPAHPGLERGPGFVSEYRRQFAQGKFSDSIYL